MPIRRSKIFRKRNNVVSRDSWVWLGILGLIVVSLSGGGFLSITASPIVQKIARAIAGAEGFFVRDSRPSRNHNPGNISSDITGTAIGSDGSLMVYSTDQDGWDALYHQVSGMLSGTSAYYNPSMTISDIAQKYVGTTD